MWEKGHFHGDLPASCPHQGSHSHPGKTKGTQRDNEDNTITGLHHGTTRKTHRGRTLGGRFFTPQAWRQQGLCSMGGSQSGFAGGCSALGREPGSTLGCQRTIRGFGSVSTTRDKNRTGQRQDKVTQCHHCHKSCWGFWNPLSPGMRLCFGAQRVLGSLPLHWSPLTYQPPVA